jgi:hypothetical protein
MSNASNAPSAGQPVDPSPAGRSPVVRPGPGDISHLALRDDGAIFVSLEDAGDRDASDRVVIPFMMLTGEEAARALQTASDGFAFAAARAVNALPKKKTG